MEGSSGDEPSWADAVQVTEDAALEAELEARRARPGPRPAVGVTDLVALRRGFWRRTGPPVEVAPERRERIESGRELHRRMERVIAPTGRFEVRVRQDGLVARIDALTDRAIELKTTAAPADPDRVVQDRPDQVEQLAMYCALAERAEGRLVTLVVRDGTFEGVVTLDFAFRGLAGIREEMGARAERFRESLARGRPDGLPRCRWFGRGCEYQAGSVCRCDGSEPEATPEILERVERVEPRPELDRELGPLLRAALTPATPPSVLRFRDLIYPRRAFFERTSPPNVAEPPTAAREERRDTFRALVETVEEGPVGEVSRLPSLAPEPDEEVAGFRDAPFLLKTSRSRAPLAAGDLVARSPQYALELGFRCAVAGRSSGRVFVARESPGGAPGPIQAFELSFAPVSVFARLLRLRLRRWESALRDGSPLGLAACPEWMYADCPYRSECGCGREAPRSQR